MTDAKNLTQLARLYGIQTSYLDMTKQRRHADPEALLLVLRAMGAGVERFEDAGEALQRRKAELEKRIVEPVMVAWDGKLDGRQFEFGYHWRETRGQRTFVISAPRQAYFPLGGSDAPGGPLKDNAAGRTAAVARRPFPERRRVRTWGVFAPIYALHSRRNPNAGDLTDFENLMDWLHDLGGTVVATLPLLGAFLDEPFEPSPYSPASRLFWNEFYLDAGKVPELEGNAEAKRILAERPRQSKFVDYRGVMAWKRRILEELSRAFFAAAAPQRLEAFRAFIRDRRNIEEYARFRAVTDRRRSGWTSWPARLRDGNIKEGDYDEDTRNYHLYAQWIVQEQLKALADKATAQNQMLYLDLPLGVHAESYDIWRDRRHFVRGVSGGAPPDPVFTKGQKWGFPPMHPEALRLSGYQYVIAYVRNHLRFARLLRIDHVMGLHRLYWIPDALTGDKGVYVEYPAEEFYAILSLESHLHRAGIVGENLGTVPPRVNAAMARHNIRQMYVVQYEVMENPDQPKLPPVPDNAVAGVNTHDMPPFRAFMDGADIADRLDLGFLDKETARKERKQRAAMKRRLKSFRAVNQFLSRSMANIVLVNLEDLWGEVLPQNVPATNQERPNWRRRIRLSIELIRRSADVAKELSHVFAHRSRSLPV